MSDNKDFFANIVDSMYGAGTSGHMSTSSSEGSGLAYTQDMADFSLLMAQAAQQQQLQQQQPMQQDPYIPTIDFPSHIVGAAARSGFSSSASSVQNSDDEDVTGDSEPASYRERRREAHTEAERKRRESIKRGYDELLTIVPTCTEANGQLNPKLSKATILQKSIDYIQYLQNQKTKQEEDLETKRRELMALTIMKANYEHILSAQQGRQADEKQQVPDEMKFKVFQQVMDRLFDTFSSNISVNNFAELSASVFSWLEEYCKPQALRELTLDVLKQVTAELERQRGHIAMH